MGGGLATICASMRGSWSTGVATRRQATCASSRRSYSGCAAMSAFSRSHPLAPPTPPPPGTKVGFTAAPTLAAANEEFTEFVNALKQEWDRIEDKYAVTTLAVAATLGMWSAGGVVSAIDRLPVVPGLMEAVGIGYSGWFAYRNLLFKPDRDAFFAKVREIYEDIICG